MKLIRTPDMQLEVEFVMRNLINVLSLFATIRYRSLFLIVSSMFRRICIVFIRIRVSNMFLTAAGVRMLQGLARSYFY